MHITTSISRAELNRSGPQGRALKRVLPRLEGSHRDRIRLGNFCALSLPVRWAEPCAEPTEILARIWHRLLVERRPTRIWPNPTTGPRLSVSAGQSLFCGYSPARKTSRRYRLPGRCVRVGMQSGPVQRFRRSEPVSVGTPDRIRTGATALRGQAASTASSQVRGGVGPRAPRLWHKWCTDQVNWRTHVNESPGADAGPRQHCDRECAGHRCGSAAQLLVATVRRPSPGNFAGRVVRDPETPTQPVTWSVAVTGLACGTIRSGDPKPRYISAPLCCQSVCRRAPRD